MTEKMASQEDILGLYDREEDEDAQLNKYLSFIIDNRLYSLEVKNIADIIEVQKITEVPDMPSYIKGIINLRGKIIPVMDMRLRLSKEERPYDERSCIININLNDITVGLIVDTVSEVLRIPQEMVTKPPEFRGAEAKNKIISGIGKLEDDSVVIILSAQKILYGEDREIVKKMHETIN